MTAAARGAGAAAGSDRRGGRVEPRSARRARDGRAASPAEDAEIKVLSGGEKRRVALCRLLLSSPDMLLLDEPTNHLDAESVLWLEQFLHEYPGTVVAVTHDRYFLDNVAGWILELDHGRGYPFEGNYSGWLEQKSARLAQEEKQESARHRKLHQELEWVRRRRARARRRARRASPRTKTCSRARRRARSRSDRHHDPSGPAPRRRRHRGEAASRRSTATSCSSTTSPSSCRAAASSGSSGRTAPARPRSSACSSVKRSPTRGRSSSARR